MNSNFQAFMDNIDESIIEELIVNCRKPFLQISKKLGTSEGTIRKRVAKLVKDGTIKKFTIETKHETNAVIEIVTSTQSSTEKINEELKKIKGIRKIMEVTGRFTIIAFLSAKNLSEINDIVERIRSTKGVLQTETFPVLNEVDMI